MKVSLKKVSTMISSKVHFEEQRINTNLQNAFIKALELRSIDQLQSLLDDKGIFMGKTKKEFILDFLELSNNQLKLKFIHEINFGISTSKYPGTEVIEFRFITLDFINSVEILDTGFGVPPMDKEYILYYALRFENGKITKIFEPNSKSPLNIFKDFGQHINMN